MLDPSGEGNASYRAFSQIQASSLERAFCMSCSGTGDSFIRGRQRSSATLHTLMKKFEVLGIDKRAIPESRNQDF